MLEAVSKSKRCAAVNYVDAVVYPLGRDEARMIVQLECDHAAHQEDYARLDGGSGFCMRKGSYDVDATQKHVSIIRNGPPAEPPSCSVL
jgi:hypothetical protein